MSNWKLGFSKRLVTPPMGVALAGYGLRPERVVAAVLDDLYARAVVLDDGKTRVALVSVDVIGIDGGLVNTIRKRVAAETKIAADHVLISTTHSHSAPAAQFFRQWGAMHPPYVEQLIARIGDAIIEAATNTHSVALGLGQVQVTGVAMNRQRKDGPVDHTLRVLAARDASTGSLRLAMTSFPCHPVCMETDSKFVSAEFPGRMVRQIERDHQGAAAIYFQGALGDINPINVWGGVDVAQDHGRRLADATQHLLRGIEFSVPASLGVAVVDCDLPLDLDRARSEATEYLSRGLVPGGHDWLQRSDFFRQWAHETLGFLTSDPPDTLRCTVQAIRIGDAAIVGLSGEMYTLIGDAIRKESPFQNTWVLGFANGSVGYVTDPRDYEENSYAASAAPRIYGHPPFQPHAWRAVCDAAAAALKRLL